MLVNVHEDDRLKNHWEILSIWKSCLSDTDQEKKVSNTKKTKKRNQIIQEKTLKTIA